MKLKAEKLIAPVSITLLSFSVAYLISSLALLKIKPCFNIELTQPLTKEKPKVFGYLVERKGFFLSRKTKKEEEEGKVEVVNTFSNLTLKGTVVCSGCNHSIAILKESSGKTVVLTQGQEINGYKLKKVLPDSIILERNGRKLILKLEEKKLKAQGNSPFRTENTLEKVWSVKRSQIIEEISSGEFLKYINIVPTKNPEGLRVNYVNPKSFIYKLGIRPGDIITSINDVHIKSPEDSFSAFEKLKSSDSITITVLRNGKEVKLHYNLE